MKELNFVNMSMMDMKFHTVIEREKEKKMNKKEILDSMVIEDRTPTIQVITFNKLNEKEEKIMIEFFKVEHDPNIKNDLMNLWVKHGFMKSFIPSHWSIQTYVTEKSGNCYSRYNPQHNLYKRCEKGKLVECRPVLNFDYVVEATEENKKWLIDKVIELAYNL